MDWQSEPERRVGDILSAPVANEAVLQGGFGVLQGFQVKTAEEDCISSDSDDTNESTDDEDESYSD
jgi:hypothetical protein